MIDIRELLKRGRVVLDQEHAEKEKALAGHPRVGSSGAVDEDGEIIGTCHRIALARLLGYDKPVEDSQKIMFDAGEANEDTWMRLLGPGYQGKLLRHSDCPVKHKIEGVDPFLIGNPDIILAGDDNTPHLGLELKGIFGYTTAISVYYEGVPKTENLVQAAAYSYCLGIDYALCYTCANWTKLQYYDMKKYGDKNIKPFYRIFYMEWRDGVLFYRDEFKTEWVKTLITPKSIEDYYRLVVEMRAKQDLGPRPSGKSATGTPPKWSPCGLCEFASACDKYDDGNRDYEEWINSVELICKQGVN